MILENLQRKISNKEQNDQESISDAVINKEQISIKSLQTKFMPYINKLNSSIQNFKIKGYRTSNQDHKSLSQCTTITTDKDIQISGSLNQNSKEYSLNRKMNLCKKYSQKKFSSKQRIKVKICGKGTIQLENGSLFTGTIQDGQMKQGQIKFLSGISYYGQIRNSLFHGKGLLKFPNGICFKGCFQRGVMQEKGQILYPNGDRYIGEISHFKKHGQGQLQFQNGNRYIGEFRNGQISGQGTYFINEYPVAKGKWKQGQFLGSAEDWVDRIKQSNQKSF